MAKQKTQTPDTTVNPATPDTTVSPDVKVGGVAEGFKALADEMAAKPEPEMTVVAGIINPGTPVVIDSPQLGRHLDAIVEGVKAVDNTTTSICLDIGGHLYNAIVEHFYANRATVTIRAAYDHVMDRAKHRLSTLGDAQVTWHSTQLGLNYQWFLLCQLAPDAAKLRRHIANLMAKCTEMRMVPESSNDPQVGWKKFEYEHYRSDTTDTSKPKQSWQSYCENIITWTVGNTYATTDVYAEYRAEWVKAVDGRKPSQYTHLQFCKDYLSQQKIVKRYLTDAATVAAQEVKAAKQEEDLAIKRLPHDMDTILGRLPQSPPDGNLTPAREREFEARAKRDRVVLERGLTLWLAGDSKVVQRRLEEWANLTIRVFDDAYLSDTCTVDIVPTLTMLIEQLTGIRDNARENPKMPVGTVAASTATA